MKHRIALAAALAFVLALPARARAEAPAFVYDYSGAGSNYSIDTLGASGPTYKIDAFLPLPIGARIKVVRPFDTKTNVRNELVLQVGRDRIDLDYDAAPYCVGYPGGDCTKKPQPAAPVSAAAIVFTNVFSSVRAMIGGTHDDRNSDQTESMLPRGATVPPIVIPVLSREGQRLVAGDRALHLEWTGGTAPFVVSLDRSGAAPALATQTSGERAATLPIASFAPGIYHVDIVDRQHRSGIGAFVVVAANDVPALAADERQALEDPSLTPDVRTTLEAALLAQKYPDFEFEAYERVAPLAATSPPADLLRYRLAEGE